MLTGTENNLISNNRYIVRFARDDKDIIAAQKLRFNVYNIELGEGLTSSFDHQLDADKYDEQCHHLLVMCKRTGDIIGTYRMQTHDIAQKYNGFYTAKEYKLEKISSEILNASVEVGRACVEAEHRNGRVLFLLWRGLAKYLVYYKKRYLFGCCSLTTQSPRVAWTTMKYLEKQAYLHHSLMVPVTKEYVCKRENSDKNNISSISLPQLFRLYMNLGAKVCSPPALDKAFKTIDFLVLLDINELGERSKILFFK